MSTKAIASLIEQFIENAEAQADGVCKAEQEAYSAAKAELEAIRKAAKALDRLHVGDYTYRIRDRAAEDISFTGNTWEHPDVKAWGAASVLLGAIAKEA